MENLFNVRFLKGRFDKIYSNLVNGFGCYAVEKYY